MIEGEEYYKKAGRIAAEIKPKIMQIVKPEILLIEAVELIEQEILKKGAKPAFPVDLSCNEIAAHYSPLINDKNIATGLVKVDFGVSVNGYLVDTAMPFDFTPEEKYKDLIKASEEALAGAIKVVKPGVEIREIGKKIYEIITAKGFSPIRNLSGHEVGRYNVHAGITIPNYDNGNKNSLNETVFAIEPFSTPGVGLVYEGKPSGVYQLKEKRAVRDMTARKIFKFIEKEYNTLPFSIRWLHKEFGSKALLALNFLEQQGIIHQFSTLVEKSRAVVSQSENTVMISEGKVSVLVDDN